MYEIEYTPRARTVHGASVGIVILDTRFQRLPGDIGNAESFPFPVQYAVSKGVRNGSSLAPEQSDVLNTFIETANSLIDMGVDGIATSCGFLSRFQSILTERLSVPVATSSLLQVPLVQRLLPKGQQVGVITALASALSPAHFEAVGAAPDTPLAGIPLEGVMRYNLSNGISKVNYHEQEKDVLAAARELINQNPNIGAIVLECTNLSPYSAAIEQTFGLPVFDVVNMINWFQRGLRPRSYR